MMTGKASGLPVALLIEAGFRTIAPSAVAMDQLLCLPEPFTWEWCVACVGGRMFVRVHVHVTTCVRAHVRAIGGVPHVVEGLLVQEGGEAMLGRGLLDDLHDHEILVDLRGGRTEQRGELELVRGDLTVASLERDA